VLAARTEIRRGAVYLAGELGLVASTVGRILARHGVPALAAVDPITGESVRRPHSGIRYERAHPGDLLHAASSRARDAGTASSAPVQSPTGGQQPPLPRSITSPMV
jgi:hypothetical protein